MNQSNMIRNYTTSMGVTCTYPIYFIRQLFPYFIRQLIPYTFVRQLFPYFMSQLFPYFIR